MEFVSVGYVIRDILWGEPHPGGSALYSAVTASRFGLSSAIITSAETGFPHPSVLGGIPVFRSSAEKTTEFVHFYGRDSGVNFRRVSYCLQLASPPSLSSAVPWRDSRVVYLCPNWDEVTPEAVSWFETDCVGLFPQGWFRQSDPTGLVSFGRSPWHSLPRRVKLIVVSEEDICNDNSAWDWMKESAQVAICTRGKKGYTLAYEGREESFRPIYMAEEVDPTGAGDVFGAVTLISLSQGWSPVNSAYLGSVAASFAVEKLGLEGVPTRGMVLERMQEMNWSGEDSKVRSVESIELA